MNAGLGLAVALTAHRAVAPPQEGSTLMLLLVETRASGSPDTDSPRHICRCV